MRSSRFSETPCSNECASSCTSSHGMPKTCTRKASIRRWRVTMRLADRLADVGERAGACGRRVRRSRRRRAAAPSRARSAARRRRRARGWPASGRCPPRSSRTASRVTSTVDVRASIRWSLPGGGAEFRADRYRRGGGGTSSDHGVKARRGSVRSRGRRALARRRLPARRRGRRKPRLDDLGQQPGAAVAGVRLAAHDQERGSVATRVVAPDRRRRSRSAALPASRPVRASAATST